MLDELYLPMSLHGQYAHGMSYGVYETGIEVVVDHDGHDPG